MKIRSLLLLIIFCMVSCGGASGGNETRGPEAEALIRRNLLDGDEDYLVENPRAFQFGTLHVDGPSGGMLYRFGTPPAVAKWLIEQHHLQQVAIETADQLPLDFLDDRPSWWNPWKTEPSAYYVLTEVFATGGVREVIVVFDITAGIIYAAEHFVDMPGI